MIHCFNFSNNLFSFSDLQKLAYYVDKHYFNKNKQWKQDLATFLNLEDKIIDNYEHPILELICFKLFNMEKIEAPIDFINKALSKLGEADLIRKQDIETGPFEDEGNIYNYTYSCSVELK